MLFLTFTKYCDLIGLLQCSKQLIVQSETNNTSQMGTVAQSEPYMATLDQRVTTGNMLFP